MGREDSKHVVIVGGGTAGWLTAGILAARLGLRDRDDLKITLVESPGVPILGVGEGTWPTIRHTLRVMGISEAAFLGACDATFKQGSTFVGWRTSPDEKSAQSYTHPFTPPHKFGDIDWASALAGSDKLNSFDEAVCFQSALCNLGLAPKTRTSAEYEGVGNYAYHFDAGKVARFLSAYCTATLGICHIIDDISGCTQSADGAITALNTRESGLIEADLYIDCSGQHGVLIDRVYHVPLVNCRDVLFVDKALAIQVPYVDDDAPIASVTLATAQPAGWIWDIGLTTRRGIGYVYSSAYCSPEEANATLAGYVRAITGQDLPAKPRSIDINTGYRANFWVHNCVAIGVASGFVEPLEASSIAMIEVSANHIAEHLTFDRDVMRIEAQRFNRKLARVWQDVIDFLKLHYVLSDRPEPFWAANRARDSIPQSLQDNLHVWQNRAPRAGDFPETSQLFGPASYQYILYGMGVVCRPESGAHGLVDQESVRLGLAEVEATTAKLSRMLGPNRDVIRNMTHDLHGLPKDRAAASL